MSTHCTISLKSDDNIRTTYCHTDGYPEGVGYMLVKHYMDVDKISELLDLGYIRSLRENLYPVPLPPKKRTRFQKLFGLNKTKELGIVFDPIVCRNVETSEPHSLKNPWIDVTIPLEERYSDFFEPSRVCFGIEPENLEPYNYMFDNGIWLFKSTEYDWVNLRDYLIEDLKSKYPTSFHHLIDL